MRLLIVLACCLAGCLAQTPHPCECPPLMSGGITVFSQHEQLWAFAKYLYDALGHRIRLKELGSFQNHSFTYDVLLLFRENVMYEIHDHNRTCKKIPLKADFQPWRVPKDAKLLGQAVLGTSSGPGAGLLVNTWIGDLPEKLGKYMSTVTEFGCIPVTTVYHTTKYGWAVMSFVDNVVGIEDPNQLNPPSFCTNAMSDTEAEPSDFLRMFLKKN